MPMTITVKKLESERDQARTACGMGEKTIDYVTQMLNAGKKLAEDKKLTPEDREKLKSDLYTLAHNAIVNINNMSTACGDYARLLDDIMTRTELDWPPFTIQKGER